RTSSGSTLPALRGDLELVTLERRHETDARKAGFGEHAGRGDVVGTRERADARQPEVAERMCQCSLDELRGEAPPPDGWGQKVGHLDPHPGASGSVLRPPHPTTRSSSASRAVHGAKPSALKRAAYASRRAAVAARLGAQ